jgi:glycosyltransferase involved in cell wall biosynthesis
MIHPVKVSIVIPARNEAANLRGILPRLVALLPEAEILVVDDGSSDDTAAVCTESKVKHLRHPYPKGNGAAIKTGARAAQGEVIVFMDGDGQHKPEDVPVLIEKFQEGYDMVVGARQTGSQAGLHRAAANDIFSRFASWMVMQPIADLTSGFRVVRASRFRQFLYLLPNGFSYPTTITMSFFRAGYSVAYLPIHSPRRSQWHQPYPSPARRFALPADHHQDWHALLSAKALFADQRGVLPDGPCLLFVYLSGCRTVYQHERAVVHLCGLYLSDRDCFRADICAAL